MLLDALRHERGVLRLRDHPELRRQVDRAVTAGSLVRLLPGVVAPPSLARDSVVLARAAWLYDPSAVLLGRTSARHTHWNNLTVPLAEVSLRRRPRTQPPPGLVFHELRWPAELVHGSGALMALSLPAATLWSAEVGDLSPMFEGLRNHFTVEQLRRTAAMAPRGHRAQWQRIVRRVRMGPWSHPELDLHEHFRRRGVTGWKANHRVVTCGRKYFLDAAFERERVGLEVESREFHEKWQDLKKDWRRHNRLTLAGWTILHVDTDRLLTEPDAVVDEVCALVNRRSAEGRARGWR